MRRHPTCGAVVDIHDERAPDLCVLPAGHPGDCSHLSSDAPRRLIPLRCTFCGETWTGPASLIGRACNADPLAAPAVVQCEPEELERSIDWGKEVF